MKLFQRKLLCSFKFYDQPCLYIAVYKYGYKINFVFSCGSKLFFHFIF